MRNRIFSLIVVALVSCKPTVPTTTETTSEPEAAQVDREAFNRIAAELALPLFWRADDDGDQQVDSAELAVLWGVDDTDRSAWVAEGKLTARFTAARDAIVKVHAEGHDFSKQTAAEKSRRTAVLAELAQGKPTLVFSDFTAAPAEDRAIVTNILAAADLIEAIYAQQNGVAGLGDQIPADDTMSRMMFYRNQSPWCAAPETEKNPDCHALANTLERISGLYPKGVQAGKADFCTTLGAREDQKTLMSPFVTVASNDAAELRAVPYTDTYAQEMKQISELLTAAAAAIADPNEAAFKTYLTATAKAFLDNDWQPADEAWAAMNVNNSKWYLRVGPDETYFEPCGRKAGFHVSFAKINQGSVTWQKRLEPVKNEMEQALAELAGPPYQAREVSFHMPDFIDMVLNAGDSRSARGATIGQSLPNWGPVANEGRGRTVVMTNLYTDPDSLAIFREQAASVFCADTLKMLPDSGGPQVMSTVLHEAAHNLGPAHEYKVDGKVDEEIFGGPLAATMEELKAQTAALYLADWLVEKKVITAEAAQVSFIRDIAWAIGHWSRGMYTADNRPRTYSQLASIQGAYLHEAGALEWRAEEKAANGEDVGCLFIHHDKTPKVVKELMAKVAGLKSRGDKAVAEELIKKYVDAKGAWDDVRAKTGARWRRAPKASFVYAVRL